jgi:DNA-binding transcriptional ArsR family regulator
LSFDPGYHAQVSDFDLQRRAKVFKALCDPTRLQIVEFLADGEERTGTDISDALGITLALLCHHTGTLEDAGLLIKRKQGQSCYHRLQRPALEACLSSLSHK